METEGYIDLIAVTALVCVTLWATVCAVRALQRRQYGFAGWLKGYSPLALVVMGVFAVCHTLPGYGERLELYCEYVTEGAGPAEGEVVYVAQRRSGRMRSVRFYHAIRYQDAGGQMYRTCYNSREYMSIGTKVPVYYKPENPQDAYVVTYHESWLNGVFGIIFGSCFLLLSFVGLVVLWLNRKGVTSR